MAAHLETCQALYETKTLAQLEDLQEELLDALTSPDQVESDNLDGVGNTFKNATLAELRQKLEDVRCAIGKHKATADTPTNVRGRLMHYHRAAE